MPISRTYMQTAQHLQERREHPRTEAGTAQNTYQMEETINSSNIYKMQMWIKWWGRPRTPISLPAYRARADHLPSYTLSSSLNTSRSVSLTSLTAYCLCSLLDSFLARHIYFFSSQLPVFTSLLLASRLCDYLLFSCQASTYIKGHSMIGC